MKKITLLLFCLMGYMTYGQVNVNENFDAGTPAGWTGNYNNTTESACAGSSERVNLYSYNPSANLTTANYAGASNATDLNISFDYVILDYAGFYPPDAATPAGWGSAELQYSTDDGMNWTTILTIDDLNHVVSASCATMMATVLAVDLPNGSDVKLQIVNTWVAGDYYFYVDNFIASQTITSEPNCDAALTTPTDGAIEVNEETNLEWSFATGAPDGYRLSVGTTSGGTDIVNDEDVGNSTTYDLPVLSLGQQYYVNITPYNVIGDATGCTEESFTVRASVPPGESCSGAIAATVETDCSTATPNTIDFATVIDLGDVGTCDTGTGNNGAWYEFTTTSAPGITISSTDTGVEYAIFDSCGGTQLECGNFGNGSVDLALMSSTNYKLAIWKDGADSGTADICIQEFTPPPPPVNDDCANAIALTPGAVYNDNPVDGTVAWATADAEDVDVCGEPGPGVWYSVVVPAAGDITIETGPDAGTSTTTFDSVIEVFEGSCGTLVSVACDDDGASSANFSIISLTGRTPGETLYIRVWEYLGDEVEPFSISAYSSSLSIDDLEDPATFTYYPNPVENTLTLKAQNNIEHVAMYNMLGQEVLRTTPNTIDNHIDMSGLQTGTYFVKVTIANSTKTVRVIKQ